MSWRYDLVSLMLNASIVYLGMPHQTEFSFKTVLLLAGQVAAAGPAEPDAGCPRKRLCLHCASTIVFFVLQAKSPPPDLPSLMLDARIVYLGMPLVSAVTELIIAELLYLQYRDRTKPMNMYINSTGTTRADGESVRRLVSGALYVFFCRGTASGHVYVPGQS